MGDQVGLEKARGIMPKTVVAVVKRMGRKRILEARMIASFLFFPSILWLLMASISKIALLTKIPAKATMPIIPVKERVWPIITSPGNIPMVARGIVIKINKGWRKDLNCKTIIMAIAKTPKIKAFIISARD